MRSGLYNELLDKVEQFRLAAGTVTVKLPEMRLCRLRGEAIAVRRETDARLRRMRSCGTLAAHPQHPYLRSEPCSLRHCLGEAQSPAFQELR
jgi:hypothetical protein